MGSDTKNSRLDRRTYVKSSGAVLALASFAGCGGGGGDGGDGGGGSDGGSDGSDGGGSDGSDGGSDGSDGGSDGSDTQTTAEPAGDVDMGGFMVPQDSIVDPSEVSEAAQIPSQEMSVVSQSDEPDMWNATQQWIEFVTSLGIDIEVRAHPRGAQLDWVWTNGHQPGDADSWWDLTTWSFSPRPSRLDPHELLFNHHSSMQAGYNFSFWEDDTFDTLVEEQRAITDQEERQQKIFEIQEYIHENGIADINASVEQKSH